jgi:hypothetical protein
VAGSDRGVVRGEGGQRAQLQGTRRLRG